MRPHAVSQAGSNTYNYDTNGNMTSGAGKTITYDSENRPTSITTASGATTMAYDYSGERVKKVANGVTTTYIGSLYECISSGCAKYIFAGSTRIVLKDNLGGVYYYHSDHLGSSTVVTNSSGTSVQSLAYYPYGSTRTNTGSVDVHHKFTGQELDDSTALYYYHARYYDPGLGRFIQADTFTMLSPQGLNRYSYVLNNPLTYTDPTGHFAVDLVNLMMPPSWSVPSGMNLGPMGPPLYRGMRFTSVKTIIEGQGLPGEPERIITETTSSMISGNEAMAQYYRRYGSFFSASDIFGMTWDRSRFWDAGSDETTKRVWLRGEQQYEAFSPSLGSFNIKLMQAQHERFMEWLRGDLVPIERPEAFKTPTERIGEAFMESASWCVAVGGLCTAVPQTCVAGALACAGGAAKDAIIDFGTNTMLGCNDSSDQYPGKGLACR